MRRYVYPIGAGIASAAAWTWWTQAVSSGQAIQTAVSEFALIFVCRLSWKWYREDRDAEWWLYAVTSAVASGIVVHFGAN